MVKAHMCWYWKWGTTAIVTIISSETQRHGSCC